MRQCFVLLATLSALCMSVPPAFAQPLSGPDFVQAFADAAAREGFASKKIDGPDLLLSVTAGEVGLQLNLENAYSEYLAAPEEIENIFARWFATLSQTQSETKPTPTEIRQNLVLVVRPSSYFGDDAAKDSGRRTVSRPIAGDLTAFLMMDGSTTLKSASYDMLADADIDVSQAWELAADNVRTRTGPIQAQGGGPGAFALLNAESGLAPSLIAMPTTCPAPPGSAMENAVFLLIDRYTVIHVRSDDKAAMDAFWGAFDRVIRSDDPPLSRTPVTCKNGTWVALTPPR